jgi:hypothetical protein
MFEEVASLDVLIVSWTDGNVFVSGELQVDPRSALRAQMGLFGEGRHWDPAADRRQIGSVLPDQAGRDVCGADESLSGWRSGRAEKGA